MREKESRRGTRGAGNSDRRSEGRINPKRKLMLADDSKDVGQFDSKNTHRALANQNGTDSLLSEAHNTTKKKDNESLNLPSTPAPVTADILNEEENGREPHINPDDLIELQERITKEILNSKLKEKEMLELQVSLSCELNLKEDLLRAIRKFFKKNIKFREMPNIFI